MSQGIDRVAFSPPPQHLAQVQAQVQLEGNRGGEKVTVGGRSDASLVEQSLEELPANLSEKRSSKLAERSARSKSSSRLEELLRKYVQGSSQAHQPERFEQCLHSLKKQGKATPDQLKQRIRDQFKDNESAALLFLEEALAAEGGNDDLVAVVRQVKTELGTELQGFVQSELQSFDSLADVYLSLAGQNSQQDFLMATELLIRRLGTDMHAQGSAVEPAQLKATLDTLYQLEVARNTFLAFADLTSRMASSQRQTWQGGPHRLMQEVLPLKDQRWLDGGKLTAALDRLNIRGHEPRIYFLRELYVVFGGLPDKVYADHEARLRVTGAVQEALDAAISEEEA